MLPLTKRAFILMRVFTIAFHCMTVLLTQAYSNSVLSGLDNATIVYTRAAAGARFYEILVIKRKQKPCA